MRRLIPLLFVMLCPALAHADDAAQLVARLPRAPTIEQTLRAAARTFDAQSIAGADARARLGALLPQVELRAGLRDDKLEEERFREDLFYDPTLRTLKQDSSQNQGRGQQRWGRDLSVRLRFDLGRLIFDPREVQAAKEKRAARGDKERIMREVARLYYARRKSQAELLLVPITHVEKRIDLMLAVERDGALLDALTGGWFLQQEEASR